MTSVLLALTLSAQALPPGPPPGPPPHEVLLAFADDLGLDDETRAAVQETGEEAIPELQALHRELMEDGPTRAEVEALQAREREYIEDLHTLLTEAQWEEAKALLPPPPRERPGAP